MIVGICCLFAAWKLVVVKGLVYFDELKGDDTGSLVKRSDMRGQKKSDPKDTYDCTKKTKCALSLIRVTRIHPWSQAWGRCPQMSISWLESFYYRNVFVILQTNIHKTSWICCWIFWQASLQAGYELCLRLCCMSAQHFWGQIHLIVECSMSQC